MNPLSPEGIREDVVPPSQTIDSNSIQLEGSWKGLLLEEFQQPYMQKLKAFLREEYSRGKTIYPKGNEYFAALNSTPFNEVKVVILGQDPYHGPGQAHGLCFSVRQGVEPPPSLKNIFRELREDLGLPTPQTGYLAPWAQRGVLLLNAVLTVEQNCAASHQNRGWERFTDRIISLLNERRNHLVFILWGSYAQAKGQFVDGTKHLILRAPHPSPLSASRGFFGSKPFSQANRYLESHGIGPIDWRL